MIPLPKDNAAGEAKWQEGASPGMGVQVGKVRRRSLFSEERERKVSLHSTEVLDNTLAEELHSFEHLARFLYLLHYHTTTIDPSLNRCKWSVEN